MLKKDLILGVVIALIVGVVIGYVLGIGQRKQPVSPQPPEDVITLKKSNVISRYTATANGEVAEILDRTLTLKASGENLKIKLREDVRVDKIVYTGETEEELRKIETNKIEFNDVKVGDKVGIFMELADGEWIGTNITVLPPTSF